MREIERREFRKKRKIESTKNSLKIRKIENEAKGRRKLERRKGEIL